ncbi:hypothetical protein [Bradyrhizobium sp. CCBAU 53340]|uniref:hypothetical protein n=1 Tax=Bradyrhizobium sp. CCBAU 53340 TaxID=1325112 RepID=UPI001FEF112C|nr:hypothetical protein [Bradyrhizobium sp. CCBAU 53340]
MEGNWADNNQAVGSKVVNDGQNGKIIYQVGTKSFTVPVTKYPPADSSSSVDRTA